MRFWDLADLERLTKEAMSRLPRDIGVVVSLSESSTYASSLVSTVLRVPQVSSVEFAAWLWHKRETASGLGYATRDVESIAGQRIILFIADSLCETRPLDLLSEAEYLRARGEVDFGVSSLAIFALRTYMNSVNICQQTVSSDDLFSWNWMHSPVMREACIDMDGVLCVDPPIGLSERSIEYSNFLATAAPLFLPSEEVLTIVTGRLDRYMPQTEEWLSRHGVQYRRLAMYPSDSAKNKLAAGGGAPFKASILVRDRGAFFVESSTYEAAIIARNAGKPVLSLEDNVVIGPNGVATVLARYRSLLHKVGPSALRQRRVVRWRR